MFLDRGAVDAAESWREVVGRLIEQVILSRLGVRDRSPCFQATRIVSSCQSIPMYHNVLGRLASPSGAAVHLVRTLKRIARKPGIEVQRLGLAPEEGELLEVRTGAAGQVLTAQVPTSPRERTGREVPVQDHGPEIGPAPASTVLPFLPGVTGWRGRPRGRLPRASGCGHSWPRRESGRRG